MTRAMHDPVEALITERTGLSFGGSRGVHLAKIVSVLLAESRQADASATASPVPDGVTFARLCDALTVQESFFFREPSRLALVREELVPAFRERRSTVRVWSVGCARGEEAYTLSILLAEAELAQGYRVLGTDLSAAAVAAAERGTYGPWALRGLAGDGISRWFESGPEGHRVADRFRSRVAFAQHNLLDPLPPGHGPFDLVVCRNVLIYFTPEAIRRAAVALTAALVPGGWLLLGVSDPVLDGVPDLERVQTAHGPAYRRRTVPAPDEPPAVAPARTGARKTRTKPPAPPRQLPERRRSRRAPSGPDRPPDDPIEAARHALMMGDAYAAVDLAQRALEVSADRLEAHRLLIQALAEDGRLRDALAAAVEAVAEFPNDGRLRELQAVVLLEAGQTHSAQVAARQAVYLDPGSASAHLLLARAHELVGDAPAAQRARRNGRMLGVSSRQP